MSTSARFVIIARVGVGPTEGQTMLKGLDPLLSPDLLHTLAAMGHGDTIVVADANFPAASVAIDTVLGRELRTDADAVEALRAILSVLPLDSFVPKPVTTMQVVDDPAAVPPIVAAALPLIEAEGGSVEAVERFDFYDAARTAFAVLQTSERRLYGNFILKKGVVPPDG
ncbi:RbsD/FucU family protein [Acuticoccus mangrovi]